MDYVKLGRTEDQRRYRVKKVIKLRMSRRVESFYSYASTTSTSYGDSGPWNLVSQAGERGVPLPLTLPLSCAECMMTLGASIS
jgi:hypothetical protein